MNKFSYLFKFWWTFFYLLVLMQFWRALFLVSQFQNLSQAGLPSYLKAFAIGLRLDAVVVSYLMIPLAVTLCIFLALGLKASLRDQIYYLYIYGVSFLISFFNAIDIFFFNAFNAHLDIILVKLYVTQYDSLRFILDEYPVLAVWICMTLLAVLLYKVYEIVFKHIRVDASGRLIRSVGIILSTILLGSAARGGWQERPIDWGHAMFSQDFISNQVALNSIFFFGRSVIQLGSDEKARDLMNFYEPTFALQVTRDILDGPGAEFTGENTLQRTRTHRGGADNHNVVLVVLESHVGEYCGYINKSKASITPVLDSLARNGIAFTNCFATGRRSAYGLSSILMSWPSLPGLPLISCIESINEAPSIASTLKEIGYQTHFIYGGDAQFDNMKGFMNANGFSRVIERRHFRNGEEGTQWGIYDHHVFQQALNDLRQVEKPIFLTLFTTTNHQPWRFPEVYQNSLPRTEGYETRKENVQRGMAYVDLVLGEFMQEASKEAWFNNTVFIFISDHGAPVYNHQLSEVRNARIPLVVYSPGIGLAQRVIDSPVSQVDVGQIILDLIDYSKPYTYFGQHVLSDSLTIACRIVGDRAYWIEHDYIYSEVFGQSSTLFKTNLTDLSKAEPVISKDLTAHFQKRFRAYIQTASIQLRKKKSKNS